MGYNDGRKQLRRLLELVRTLENTQHGMRVAVLARLYDVDQTRIYNDLKIIAEFYNLEKKNGFYRIINERPPLTQKELTALTAAVNAFSHSNGNPLEKQLRKALQKLHRPVAKYIQNRMDQDTDISIQLKTGGHYEKLDEFFDVFQKALYNKKAVRATYKSAANTEPIQHLLYPYAIFFRKEDWYLEAHSDQHEETSRTFKIIRFQRVELTDEDYQIPSEFSLSKNLESRWELFSGDPVDVEVKIAAHKAYLIKEKEYHHSQEIIHQTEDGSVTVRYYIPTEEFTFWVLSLGDAAEVLSPPEFRAKFQDIVQRMHNIYMEN
ncbi:MAG: WYL domain-containing protein [Candidatus Poribacteria bacterium]|nr:WYL domain-containing protein [Candidatus Poribacteria bacterium]